MSKKISSLVVVLCALLQVLAPQVNAQTNATGIQVNSFNGRIIGVHFDNPIDPVEGAIPGNYSVYGKSPNGTNIVVTNVVIQADGQTAALYLNQFAGEFFSVGASNIEDSIGGVVAAAATGATDIDFLQTSIGSGTDPNPAGEIVPFTRDTFEITASGSGIGGTNDHCHFLYQQIVGNFETSTMVTRLDATDPNSVAGLMVRESLFPGSRSFEVLFTPVDATSGSNMVQLTFRSSTNGNTFTNGVPVMLDSLQFLRLTRTNNTITAYYGTNGSTWTTLGSNFLSWTSNAYVGTTVSSHVNGQTTTAGFTSFDVSAIRPGDNFRPTLKTSVYQKTNLVVMWQRTPRDFTVQVATNTVGNTNTSINTYSNATLWSYILLPIMDTSLTGTNDIIQATNSRYMVIPMSLLPYTNMAVRLIRTQRVIPDPVNVTPGMTLSQSSGSMNATVLTGGNMIGGTAVNTSTAVAQNGVPVICPPGHSYQFSTWLSGFTLHTAILVRGFPNFNNTWSDGSYTAGNYKSQVTVTPPLTGNLGYTFVVAATADSPAVTCGNTLRVQINILP